MCIYIYMCVYIYIYICVYIYYIYIYIHSTKQLTVVFVTEGGMNYSMFVSTSL